MTVTIPGPIRECGHPHCAEARANIESLAHLDTEWLERQIVLHEKAIRDDLTTLVSLREAVRLREERR